MGTTKVVLSSVDALLQSRSSQNPQHRISMHGRLKSERSAHISPEAHQACYAASLQRFSALFGDSQSSRFSALRSRCTAYFSELSMWGLTPGCCIPKHTRASSATHSTKSSIFDTWCAKLSAETSPPALPCSQSLEDMRMWKREL
jgi:hypothetical protein